MMVSYKIDVIHLMDVKVMFCCYCLVNLFYLICLFYFILIFHFILILFHFILILFYYNIEPSFAQMLVLWVNNMNL